MFHLLDSVIGRKGYRSFIGGEAMRLRESYPDHWREFIGSVSFASLAEFAGSTAHPPLSEALEGLRSAYAGAGGLLARHRLKVAGYLDTSYRVGRDVTISGYPAAVRVGTELAASRGERPAGPEPSPVGSPQGDDDQGAGSRSIRPTELLRHDHRGTRKWVSVDGGAFDVTDFLRRHPGGAAPLVSYLGTDATQVFAHLGHATDPGVTAILNRLRIGTLRRPDHLYQDGHPAVVAAYHGWLGWAVELTRRGNALPADLSIRDARTTMVSGTGELTPYTLQFAIEAHERFQARTRRELLGDGLQTLAESVAALDPSVAGRLQELVREAARGATAAPVRSAERLYRAMERTEPWNLKAVDEDRQHAVHLDGTFLETVRGVLIDGLEVLEAATDLRVRDLAGRLADGLDAIWAAGQTHCRGVEALTIDA